jgi:hypothetical protein
VILELCANDGLRGLPLVTVRDNLAHMGRMAQTWAAHGVLGGCDVGFPLSLPAALRELVGLHGERALEHLAMASAEGDDGVRRYGPGASRGDGEGVTRGREIPAEDDRARERDLSEQRLLSGQQAAELLERAVAPRGQVMRVLDRPERVVGHAEDERRAALGRETRRERDQGKECC